MRGDENRMASQKGRLTRFLLEVPSSNTVLLLIASIRAKSFRIYVLVLVNVITEFTHPNQRWSKADITLAFNTCTFKSHVNKAIALPGMYCS